MVAKKLLVRHGRPSRLLLLSVTEIPVCKLTAVFQQSDFKFSIQKRKLISTSFSTAQNTNDV
jgi:hypothetical protein